MAKKRSSLSRGSLLSSGLPRPPRLFSQGGAAKERGAKVGPRGDASPGSLCLMINYGLNLLVIPQGYLMMTNGKM